MNLVSRGQGAVIGVAFIMIIAAGGSVRAQTADQGSSMGQSGPGQKARADATDSSGAAAPAKNAKVGENIGSSGTGSVSRLDSPGRSNAEPPPKASPLNAPDQTQSDPGDKWQFQVTPYLWFAGLKGTIGIRGQTADVDVGFGDILSHLNFGFTGAFEARKRKFIILTDMLYLKVSAENATPGRLFSSVKSTVRNFTLDPEAGYRVVEKNGASLDLMGGIRFWHLSDRLLFTPGLLPQLEISASKNWVDAVFGMRVKARLSKKWFVTGKGDFGGGGSDFTYQLFGGVGADVGNIGALIVGYRYLHVNYDRSGFLFDVEIKGPIIGFGFKF
ncbi:MAG: hypothetical protein ACREDR_08335 [Blastocatellia bacterium]